MHIRAYETADAVHLAAVHHMVCPDRPPHTPASFQRHLAHILATGGRAWVIADADELAGYATVSPVSGLEGVVELEGLISPAWQRQGLAGRLLDHLIEQLTGTAVRQLSCCVSSADSPAARFLRRHHFFVEHEEWLMILADLAELPPMPAANLRSFSRSLAITEFCALYQQSFAGFPWYQPYTPAEVAAALDEPADLCFLVLQGKPAGFVWTHRVDRRLGQIEPLGVMAPLRGQGHGRTLLLAGLHQLAGQGCQAVNIGLWRDNQVALNLYKSLGFQHQQTLTYLAYNLTM